jgi:Flp pilus assembly protein TadG
MEGTMRTATNDPRRAERGQALVVFVLALVAIIAVTGLVLDGGSAFAQRRDQQNAADLAALAAAITHGNTPGDYATREFAGRSRGFGVAAANGYPHGGSIVVTVTSTAISGGVRYVVTVHRPHRNNFAGLLGQPSWNVSASASAVAGQPNAVQGAMPLIFNQEAFQAPHDPGAIEEYTLPGTGTEDVPQDATSFNWTIYCTSSGGGAECNGDSDGVQDLIEQFGEDKTIALTDQISPLNAGSHTTLFNGMEQWIGYTFPVSIVNDDGDMVGWALFTMTGVEGGARKAVIGSFLDSGDEDFINFAGFTMMEGGGEASAFGAYTIKLIR